MPKSRTLLLAAILPLALASCGRKPLEAPPSPLRLEARRFEKSLSGCGDLQKRSEPCVTFRVEWLEVAEAPSVEAKARINAALLAALQPAEAPRGFEAESAQILEDYRRFKAEFPDSGVTYFDRRIAEVSFSSAALLSIQLQTEEFHGGAHPNSRREYLNLRPRTGERVDLSSLMRGGTAPALLALVEKGFRKERGVPEGQTLAEAGFTFEDGRFILPQQWGVAPAGLVFHYNAYDVAPYDLGPTTVTVAWRDLAGLLRRDSGLPPPQ